MAEPLIAEYHSTDIMAACDRSVLLRHEGKLVGETPQAMYRGSLFHEAARIIHEGKAKTVEKAVLDAMAIVDKQAVAEKRPLTDAVAASKETIGAEVAKMLAFYRERLMPEVSKFIGCELPVRIEIDGFKFASHIDLLFRDKSGALRVWDWKTGEDQPTSVFLNRNLQLALYWICVLDGAVMVNGEWVEFGEDALVSWVHINNLKPYARKTTVSEPDGTKTEYAAGEHRPLSKIVYECVFTGPDAARKALVERASAFEAGHFPMRPDPIGCLTCASRYHCEGFQSKGGGHGE